MGFAWGACQSGGSGTGDADADVDTDTDTDVGVDCHVTPTGRGCPCRDESPQLCYSGPPVTLNVGICAQGTIHCTDEHEWTECVGETLPRPEAQPINGLDDDCNGFVDDGLCDPELTCSGSCCEAFEVCYKGECSDPAGDSDSDVDACNDERETATNPYYGGGFCCTNAGDQICVDGGSGDCYPSDMCETCCGGDSCQAASRYCGYRY